MDARRKMKRALQLALTREHLYQNPLSEPGVPITKFAAFGGGDDKAPLPLGGKDAPGTPGTRKIPKGHEYDPRALKPLAKMLWAMSVSMGHALTAYRQFTKLKSSQISPDGQLGGRGYVMSVRDIRQKLYEACEALSAISDTIHDEIHAPHWKPKLEALTKGESEDVHRYVDKAEEVMDEAAEVADGTDDMLPADATDDPTTEEDESADSPVEDEDDEEPGSELPDGGDPDTLDGFHKSKKKPKGKRKPKTAGDLRLTVERIRSLLASVDDVGFGFIANSSLPVESLPGGPRVDHLDRGEQMGPWGSYNVGEEPSQNNYDHHPRTDGVVSTVAESALPGGSTDTTETDADDFGLGGAGGARSGKGLSHSPAPSNGKGVWGPSSDLPDDPGAPTVDPKSDGSQKLEVSLQSRDPMLASAFVDDAWAPNVATSMIPNDDEEPVARSDYYPDAKGNIVSQAAPPHGAPVDHTVPAPRGGYIVHEDLSTPYVRWDSTTSDLRREAPYPYSRPKSVRNQNG